MLFSLIASAFAADTPVATVQVRSDGDKREIDAAFNLGFELQGVDPGISARFDIGQRMTVAGVVSAGLPLADQIQWTGGASLGLEVAPIRVQLGSTGSLDFRVGVGGKATGAGGLSVEGGGFDLVEWAAGTLLLSPNGKWALYGGVVAEDVLDDEVEILPRTGVSFRL